jgi:CDP-diacylglycerol--glycerol-3-phosphate 3-phosphatidyltransferase
MYLLSEKNYLISVIVFLLAACTDGIDGYIARKYNLVTNLGKLLDPLADKLLISAALISLSTLHFFAPWVAVVIISREFAVTGLRSIAASSGRIIAASNFGKFKTVSQIISLTLVMIYPIFSFVPSVINATILYFSVFITVLSGIDYFWKNKHVLH